MTAQPSLFAPVYREAAHARTAAPVAANDAYATAAELVKHPAFEEAMRLYLTPPTRQTISSWSALNDYLKFNLAKEGREQFRVLFLDKRNQLIVDECMGVGTVDHAPVYPREIVRRALELDASAVILVHNHPSGNPTPSSADVDMTKQVVEACRVMRLSVHDHLIVAGAEVTSLKALGLM